MKKFINLVKEYPKDMLIVFAALIVGFLAVSGDGFSDLANRKFWQSAWGIVGIVCLIAWVTGIALLWNSEKRK